MANKIQLLKNNDNRNWDDEEWITEFYGFLQGELPNGIRLGKKGTLKLTPDQAFSIIWYLQEHFPILPDNIDKCSVCDRLYDSYSEGWYCEARSLHYCSTECQWQVTVKRGKCRNKNCCADES